MVDLLIITAFRAPPREYVFRVPFWVINVKCKSKSECLGAEYIGDFWDWRKYYQLFVHDWIFRDSIPNSEFSNLFTNSAPTYWCIIHLLNDDTEHAMISVILFWSMALKFSCLPDRSISCPTTCPTNQDPFNSILSDNSPACPTELINWWITWI